MKMWKWILLVSIAAYLIDSIFLKMKIFEIVYNHYPGPCTQFPMNGAEDILILPNSQAIISGGFQTAGVVLPSIGNLYVLDMADPHKGPMSLKFEGSYRTDHPDFNPHGISYWVTENGDILLYIICHWNNHKDSIDVFQYYPNRKSVRYIRSVFDYSAVNLNNLVVVDEDEFYVTNWRYFDNHLLHILEQILRLPLTKVYHVKNGQFKIVGSGFKSANGIHASRNRKFIYVVSCLTGEVFAYKRSEDGSITVIDGVHLGYPIDNINIDPETGNLWIPLFIKPLQTLRYLDNQTTTVSAQILHMTVDESSDKPFEKSKIESVYTSDGSNGVGAISVAAYANNTLLLGSVKTDMLVCDVKHLHYR